MSDPIDSPEKDAKPAKKSGFLNPFYVDIAGVLVTVGSALTAGAISINNKFFSNAKRDRLFTTERDDRSKDRKEVQEKPQEYLGEKYISRMEEIEKTYKENVEKKLEARRIKGYRMKWRTLAAHQKTEVGLAATAVGAITIGAFINLASSKHVGDKEEELAQRLDELEKKHLR